MKDRKLEWAIEESKRKDQKELCRKTTEEVNKIRKTIVWLEEEIIRRQRRKKPTHKQGARMGHLKKQFGPHLDLPKLRCSLADHKDLLKEKALQLRRAKQLERQKKQPHANQGHNVLSTACHTPDVLPENETKQPKWTQLGEMEAIWLQSFPTIMGRLKTMYSEILDVVLEM